MCEKFLFSAGNRQVSSCTGGTLEVHFNVEVERERKMEREKKDKHT